MFLAAADALASMVKPEHLQQGTIYPPLKDIRAISLKIACAVAETAYEQGLAQKPRPENLSQAIENMMYDPSY